MPKSKVRKKTAYTPPPQKPTEAQARKAAPSHPAYIAVMLGLMLLGLIWLVVNYIAGDKIGFMAALSGHGTHMDYNFVVGFGLIVVGLFMTMGWR
jgi:hypothetical protein